MLACIWSIDDYLRLDELPGERGCADVAFVPKPGSLLPPMLVQLKWNKPVESALEQAKRRNYPAALSGLLGECVLAGITYQEGSDRHERQIKQVDL